MKRLCALLCCLMLLLTSCIASMDPSEVASLTEEVTDALDWETPAYMIPLVYEPDHDLEPEEVVEEYFRLLYDSYCAFQEIDMSAILNTSNVACRNIGLWMQIHNQRRRLIQEYGFCYVETERFPYTIRFLEDNELSDGRVEFWKDWEGEDESEFFLHFVIEGEEGRAYPPLFAVNAEHSIRLRQMDGVWKIIFHYFPGSVRKFYRNSALAPQSDQEVVRQLIKEFTPGVTVDLPEIPDGVMIYDGEYAAEYGLLYTEKPNGDFYHVGDWMGNCANFVSQCIWYGFSDGGEPDAHSGQNMTNSWYGGSGGGSPAWENVVYQWEELTSPSGLVGAGFEGVNNLAQGDIIQTRASYGGEDTRFNHTLVVVDEETLLLAQNSPACFVYYSDLVLVETRFARPVYLD